MNNIAPVATPWAPTFSGKVFDLINPTPDMVDINDIAEALAKQCRYNGNCIPFYSVAQHSVLTTDILMRRGISQHTPDGRLILLYALLHDAHEAYIGDITTPVKEALNLITPPIGSAIKWLSMRIDEAIFEHFGLSATPDSATRDLIKQADCIALATEKRDLLSDDGPDWPHLPDTTHPMITPMTWERAHGAFLDRFRQLTQWDENADGISYSI